MISVELFWGLLVEVVWLLMLSVVNVIDVAIAMGSEGCFLVKVYKHMTEA